MNFNYNIKDCARTMVQSAPAEPGGVTRLTWGGRKLISDMLEYIEYLEEKLDTTTHPR